MIWSVLCQIAGVCHFIAEILKHTVQQHLWTAENFGGCKNKQTIFIMFTDRPGSLGVNYMLSKGVGPDVS